MYLCFLDPSKAVSSVLSFSSLTFSHPWKENESRGQKNYTISYTKVKFWWSRSPVHGNLVYSSEKTLYQEQVSSCYLPFRDIPHYIYCIFFIKGFMKLYAGHKKKFTCSKEKVWRWCNTSRKTEDVCWWRTEVRQRSTGRMRAVSETQWKTGCEAGGETAVPAVADVSIVSVVLLQAPRSAPAKPPVTPRFATLGLC